MESFKQHHQNLSNPIQLETNKFIIDNNKRALELLLRIQSQVEASTVIATSPRGLNSYE